MPLSFVGPRFWAMITFSMAAMLPIIPVSWYHSYLLFEVGDGEVLQTDISHLFVGFFDSATKSRTRRASTLQKILLNCAMSKMNVLGGLNNDDKISKCPDQSVKIVG